MTKTLLAPDLIVPMTERGLIRTGSGIVVDGTTIVAVGDVDDLRREYPGIDELRLENQLVMPGLVNAHHHSGILRGTAEHLPVWEWLRVHIDPMHRVLRADEAKVAAALCYGEGLLSGTTTVVDMWRYMDGCAEAALDLGNRLVTVNYVGAHPEHDYFDTLDDNERMLQEWGGASGRGEGRVTPWVGLEHPFYADEAGLARVVELAQTYETGLYTHCSEAELDVTEFLARSGKRPIHALADLGFFDVPRTLLAHAVWLDDSEIEVLASRNAGTSHNPVSNMKLASGISPVAELLAAGVPVGIGTDGEKENNNLDMFEEMKVASLLGKLRTMDAAAMDSWEVLTMATIGGARAMGLDGLVGTLEPGKRADLIAVRT
ncbi:MAG: amidohydrolase family protein, partial [Pseudoclavibacter sp.]